MAFWAVAACLAMGALVGLANGLLIVKAKVPDLLATLGMMFLLIGLQRIPTQGRSIATGMRLPDGTVANGKFPPEFLALGRHRFDFFIENLIPFSVVFPCGHCHSCLGILRTHPPRPVNVCDRFQ